MALDRERQQEDVKAVVGAHHGVFERLKIGKHTRCSDLSDVWALYILYRRRVAEVLKSFHNQTSLVGLVFSEKAFHCKFESNISQNYCRPPD